jgi:hypothetical protein
MKLDRDINLIVLLLTFRNRERRLLKSEKEHNMNKLLTIILTALLLAPLVCLSSAQAQQAKQPANADEDKAIAAGTPGTLNFTDDFTLTGAPPTGNRYYRVRLNN